MSLRASKSQLDCPCYQKDTGPAESATGEPVLPTPQTEKATGGPILQEGHRASYSAHLHIQHLAKPAEGRLVGGYLQALVNCFRPEDACKQTLAGLGQTFAGSGGHLQACGQIFVGLFVSRHLQAWGRTIAGSGGYLQTLVDICRLRPQPAAPWMRQGAWWNEVGWLDTMKSLAWTRLSGWMRGHGLDKMEGMVALSASISLKL
eukprot:254662-Pelagomonas_calceolata.AAC.6